MSAVPSLDEHRNRYERLREALLEWDTHDLRRVIEDALWGKEQLIEHILENDMLSDADLDEILKDKEEKEVAAIGGFGALLINGDGTCSHYYADLMNRCRRCAVVIPDEEIKRRDAGPPFA